MPNPAPRPSPHRRRFLRFKQLKEMGVASDYAVLSDLIKKRGFPPGFKLSHKVLIFDEDEVLAWLDEAEGGLMSSVYRSRVEQVLNAFTAPLGDRDVITDRAELVDALVALFIETVREFIADTYRDRAS